MVLNRFYVIVKPNIVVLMELIISYNSSESLTNAHARKSTMQAKPPGSSKQSEVQGPQYFINDHWDWSPRPLSDLHPPIIAKITSNTLRQATWAMFDDAAKSLLLPLTQFSLLENPKFGLTAFVTSFSHFILTFLYCLYTFCPCQAQLYILYMFGTL